MECYKCNEQMNKRPYEGILADCCDSCGGVWVDSGELSILIGREEKKGQKELMQEAKRETQSEAQHPLSVVGFCPKCQEEPLQTKYRSGVGIDQCPSCKGIFFDSGEMKKVVSEEESGFLKLFHRIGDFFD